MEQNKELLLHCIYLNFIHMYLVIDYVFLDE